mmetsp:Transcript_31213/g.58601  ORF Transcript_31213/g.58601 Transcript_31213/m.58601 type:complete len:219 (-) Transcript_31213:55-711(-)
MAGGETAPLLADPRAANEEEFNAGAQLGMLAGFLIIPRAIGFGIAYGVYAWGATSLYDKKIAVLTTYQLGYLYLAAVIFCVMVHFVNAFPMYYKSKVMKQDAGNLRANMFIYKVSDDSKKHVVMEEEGSIGEYNRANRSMTHFIENSLGVLLTIALSGFVYTFPTFIFTIIFSLGRIIHQLGYASGGYGKHAPGFMLHMISSMSLEMLVLLAAVKSLS